MPSPTLKKIIPVSLLILTSAVLIGMILVLYGYTQDLALPLFLGLGMSILGGSLGALRIALWGDDR